jgi:hypothetical protein
MGRVARLSVAQNILLKVIHATATVAWKPVFPRPKPLVPRSQFFPPQMVDAEVARSGVMGQRKS